MNCDICGGHGSLVTVEKITCESGCCVALRNEFGLKVIKGVDPSRCGGATKHAAIGICGACYSKRTFQLPTEFSADYQQPSQVVAVPIVDRKTATNPSRKLGGNTSAKFRSA